MNPNDPRLELIRRSLVGGLSPEEFASFERDLCEDSGFRAVYLRYVNLDMALGAVARLSPAPTPTPAPHPVQWLSGLRRWGFRRASENAVSDGVSARTRLLSLGLSLGIAVLVGMVFPLPNVVVAPGERLLQQSSAEVFVWAMQVTGIPVTREGMVFQLPGMNIQFVQECSGLRSTLVQLLMGVVFARWVLDKTLNRAALVLAIVPFGIVLKGLWVCALASLAVRLEPEIWSTWVHSQGQAICFALSLISMIALLWWLRRSERTGSSAEK